MRRVLIFLYGMAAYAGFLAASSGLLMYLVGLWPPHRWTGESVGWRLAVDLGLILLFGLQHSLMARPTFKAWWTQYIPGEMERSTYVWASNLVLGLLVWQWRPVEFSLWYVTSPALAAVVWGVFAAGWILVLTTTFLINHFDLFGLRQVWLNLVGRPLTAVAFRTPGPYRLVRHPLYVGWLTTFWATPHMTLDRLVFALGMTVYILAAIPLEERNLADDLGPAYQDYRRRVPMLIPALRPTNSAEAQPLADLARG